MAAEEKNRNEILSRIVADLAVTSQGGEDLSSKIHRLRDEIKKIIENEETIFGKFRGLLDSFRDIIPEEKKRYQAAIKALSATSKLSQQEVVKAVNNQVSELKVLEKGLMSALPGWRDGLKAMEAKSQEIKAETAKLHEMIVKLENEEKALLSGKTAREKEMELIEKAMGELFASMGAEINYVKNKVEEITAERVSSQPIWPGDSPKSDIPAEGKVNGGQKREIAESSAPPDSEFQKKCPMCGGKMSFYGNENKWMCYTCAFEEGGKAVDERKSEILETSAPLDPELQKKCPACGGQMNFHSNEKKWLCYTCAYKESTPSDIQGAGEENAHKPASALESIVPVADMISEEDPESKKDSSQSNKQSSKKKPCPVCRRKMNWYPMDKAWRCGYCHYERRI